MKQKHKEILIEKGRRVKKGKVARDLDGFLSVF